MENNKYLIGLAHLYDIEAGNMDYLLGRFGGAKNLWTASNAQTAALKGLPQSLMDRIGKLKKSLNVDEVVEYMGKNNIQFISKFDSKYPVLLKEIHNPPLGLFIKGKLPDQDLIWVNVIGTRKCSAYGKDCAERISRELAEHGVIIISGMARGLDSMALKGALDVGGKTVAVFGCGVDICYPPENRDLYERISEKGCIISEFPPRVAPKPWHFPVRNRIMSGLAMATVVIEAPIRSGTMITVDHALSQGREVLAVPGDIRSRLSQGTNMLIKEGAHMVTCAQDVFDALGIFEPTKEEPPHDDILLDPDEKSIYGCIKEIPITLDDILLDCGLNIQNTQFVLTNLELRGKIKKLPGQRYVRSYA